MTVVCWVVSAGSLGCKVPGCLHKRCLHRWWWWQSRTPRYHNTNRTKLEIFCHILVTLKALELTLICFKTGKTLTLSNESYWFQNFFCSNGHAWRIKTDICLVWVIVSFYIEVGLGQTLTKVSDKFREARYFQVNSTVVCRIRQMCKFSDLLSTFSSLWNTMLQGT